MLKSKPTDDQWRAFFRGESSKEEYVWLKSLLDSGEADEALKRLYDTDSLEKEAESFELDKALAFKNLHKKLGSRQTSRRFLYPAVAAAATIALLLGFWFGNTILFNEQSIDYASNPMETLKISLPDGSAVVLNANSSLHYTEESGYRKVNLMGEAFFDVERNENMPFVITAKDLRVEVLGTSFNVKAYNEKNSFVTVSSGKVKVEDEDQDVVLIKGEEVAHIGEDLQKQDASTTRISWLSGKKVYENTPLKEIFEDLTSWYGIRIEASEAIKNITYTATISLDQGIEDFLTSLQISENINFTIFEQYVRLLKD